MFLTIVVCLAVVVVYIVAFPFNLYLRYLLYKNKLKEADLFASKFTPVFSRIFVKLVSKNVEVIGRENIDKNKTYLIVANHNSLFDVFVVNGYLGKFAGFVGKASLKKSPFTKLWVGLDLCATVDQNSPKKALDGILHCTYLLKNNVSQVIFPEGTRSTNGKLQEFKAGAFKPAIKAGVEVLPITIIGMDKILPKGSKIVKRHKIMLIISEPISSYEKNTVELSQEVKNIISNSLEKYGELC